MVYTCKDRKGRPLYQGDDVILMIDNKEYRGIVIECLSDNRIRVMAKEQLIEIKADTCRYATWKKED